MSKDSNEFLTQMSAALGVPAADIGSTPTTRPAAPPRPTDKKKVEVTLAYYKTVEIEIDEDSTESEEELAIEQVKAQYGSTLTIPVEALAHSDSDVIDYSSNADEQEEWDSEYGDTHNWDGSPFADDDDDDEEGY